ncbi:MAG: adhesin [Bacteroidota bacterium]|nr:adhesin [Bacteroidota bacterium]
MAQIENKKLYGRAELKKYFRNGQIPDETHFAHLIDSAVIQHDDGISKDDENGYIITPTGSSSRLITFYENMDRLAPFFYVEKDMKDSPSLKFQSGTTNRNTQQQEEASFFLHQDGRLGLGKKSSPNFKLDVNGFTASQGRTGTYLSGKIRADGNWHVIADELDNCQALEIIARAGKKGSGRFSILHAIALSAYGGSHSKIRKTRAHYGFFWNKLNLRWRGDTHNYTLQLRSNSNFGKDVEIYYNVSKLWDDELFLPQDCFYPTKDR